MALDSQVEKRIRGFVQRHSDAAEPDLQLRVKPLVGGLEGAAVARVTARVRDRRQQPRTMNFVVKVLEGRARRELAAYQFVSRSRRGLAPRLFGHEELDGRLILYLQAVRRARQWPWRDVDAARSVVGTLAELHGATPARPAGVLDDWDFDTDLTQYAETAVHQLVGARAVADLRPLARALPALERLTMALPRLRRQLRAAPFGAATLHGDVHSGNVMMRRARPAPRPVFVDWSRVRVGSPFEDVHSWLHSLGLWEREARRRHDTLLSRYLTAAGHPYALGPTVRGAYVLAGASNALAGALVFHLHVLLTGAGSGAERASHFRSATAWLRAIRLADAYWS